MPFFALRRALVLVLLVLARLRWPEAGCDNNWNWWWVGTRTQWNVTKDFYLGLDVAYTKISGMSAPGGVLPAGNIAFPAGTNLASQAYQRAGRGVVPVPRASRLLSVIV